MLPRRLPCSLRLSSTPSTPIRPPISTILRTSLLPTNPSSPLTNHLQPQPRYSSSSNSRWKTRQSNDLYARSARTAGFKSRAAFKLIEINKKYRLFRPNSGQVVVDLGFAPGSWSQVALDLTKPDGKVVGIDIIPAQPPRGVSAIQGNFLSEGVRGLVKGWLKEEEARRRAERVRRERERLEIEKRLRRKREEGAGAMKAEEEGEEREAGERVREVVGGEVREGEVEMKKDDPMVEEVVEGLEKLEATEKSEEAQRQGQHQHQQQKQADDKEIVIDRPSYIELERMAVREAQLQQEPEVLEQNQQDESKATTTKEADTQRKGDEEGGAEFEGLEQQQQPKKKKQPEQMRLVDVVLSDMSEPWPQTSGFSIKTLSNPYSRMMNTSGISFKDHAGSMDLCYAALSFANDTLKPGGHFVCKFYQGSEDKNLENMLRKLFTKVTRDKPDSSRSESKEAYFVALNRRGDVILEDIPI